MYALRFDGFIQWSVYGTLEEAKTAYASAVKNTWLYEYDCAIVEVEVSRPGQIRAIRTLSFEESK
jgi:hypothetical protein